MTRAERFRARLCVDCGETRPRVLEDGTPAIRCEVCAAQATAERYTLGSAMERQRSVQVARLRARAELRAQRERGKIPGRCRYTTDLEDYLKETER